MSKSEKWWIVIINLGGISGPICCYDKGKGHCYDKSGNYDCSMKSGIVPIGWKDSHCFQFQTKNEKDAKLFALGAQTLAKLLKNLLR